MQPTRTPATRYSSSLDHQLVKIPLTWRYLLAFFCLGALMGMSHELAHHAAGFAICGDWGYKTFNSFQLAVGCREQHPNTFWLATVAGPVLFNYLPSWIGMAMARRPDASTQLFGVSLILSTVPALRLFSAIVGGDEQWLARLHFGTDRAVYWIALFSVIALTLPPLIVAWRTIRNPFKPLVFALLFLGVPLLVFFLVGQVLEGLILEHKVLADTLWGMPYMVLLAEVLATFGYAILKFHLWQPANDGHRGTGALARVADDNAAEPS